jgi:DNA-binding transcriptional MerR regulator
MSSLNTAPATRIDITGPQLRPDQAGYVVDGRFVDGFADDRTRDVAARRRIAGWARAFGHELDDAQRALLEVPEPEDSVGLELLAAAARNTDVDLPFTAEFGLYEQLSAEELRLVREPWHGLPGNERRDYPVSVAELATLTGATAKQVREWETATLLPGARIDGRRQFFSAAVVHAFALRRLNRYQVAALANVMVADDHDVFLTLVEHTLAARRRRRAGGLKITDLVKRVMVQVRALLDGERTAASHASTKTTTATKAKAGTTPVRLVEGAHGDNEELMRGAFARTLCIIDSLDEVLPESLSHYPSAGHSSPGILPGYAKSGYVMSSPSDAALVVFPRADEGWTLSADLGLHIARKVDAVRIAKALNIHIAGSALRVYSKDDGKLIKSSRARPHQPA